MLQKILGCNDRFGMEKHSIEYSKRAGSRKSTISTGSDFSTLDHQDPIDQDSFSIYSQLESISASMCQSKKLETWDTVSSDIEKTLIQFHGSNIQGNQGSSDDPYNLELLWHSEFIQMFANLNRLEICSGRDGLEASHDNLQYARD